MISFFLSTQVEAGGWSTQGQHGPHVKTLLLDKEEGKGKKPRMEKRGS